MRRYIVAVFVAGVLSLWAERVYAQERPVQVLSLEDCRKMAVEASYDLKKADNRIQQAKYDKWRANTAYLPSLSATGGIMFSDDISLKGMGIDLSLRMVGAYMAGITLTEPIYTGGKVTSLVHLSKIQLDASEEQLRQARAELKVEADKAYWTLMAVRAKKGIIEAYQQQLDSLALQVEGAVAMGILMESDLLKVKTKRGEIEYNRFKVYNGEELCQMYLCRLLGLEENTQIILSDTLLYELSPQDDGVDISSRPEMNLLKMAVEAAKWQVRLTRSEYLPKILFMGSFTTFGNFQLQGNIPLISMDNGPFSIKVPIWYNSPTASFLASIPIFNWLEGSKNIKKSKLDYENALLDLESNQSLMRLEATRARQNMQDSYKLMEIAELSLAEAEENLRVNRNRYQGGMGLLADWLDAQSQWHQCYSNLLEARTQYLINLTEYQRTIGALD